MTTRGLTIDHTRAVAAWAIACAALFGGCVRETDPSQAGHGHETASTKLPVRAARPEPIAVVCTVGMVGDLVVNIGGDRVRCECLMGPGVDPHRYKTKPSDVRKLRAAELVFYGGLHLEGKMTEALQHLGRRIRATAVSEAIPRARLLVEENDWPDPHVWFDVSLWRRAGEAVRDVLVEFDPAYADAYRRNAEAYLSKFDKLHAEAQATLARVPKARRVLVTAHDAFRYFGRAYDIEVRGIQGISTEDEAGVRHVNELVDFLVDRQVKAVFVETSVSDRNLKALLEGCEARRWPVRLGGELFSDAMGDPGTAEGTYLGMVEHNVKVIAEALR